eukprot:gnl/TRDRNA2_/TRDRNA2_39298_c1_seq1.p1 gnl/TRDRNA2_/TRDRNA2_39298_c1~~gnl/TRDRNA2_/TRDRNA2_39298_c1_seq1.p1  ORF type:complete len:472 (+),score=185.45 gnl/TRDRNA2_/TRDRNA2_39298_c1_seq1:3-1418(+)
MLDDDTKRFEEFLQERIAKAQSTMKEAETHAKRKQDKVQRIKQLKAQISSVHSEISKLKEVREECMRYKRFLEKLTSSEWKKQQEEIKAARKAKRKEQWVAANMAGVLDKFAVEEAALDRQAAEDAERMELMKKRGKQKAKEAEEERQKNEKERNHRRRRIQKKKEEEERRFGNEYEDVSSEEEPELYFKQSRQLMETFTELEEKNLFLIQSSQETEQLLDELNQNFKHTKEVMGGKVEALKENIQQLDLNINAEKKKCDELRKSYEDKAGTAGQDKKLADLFQKVRSVYLRCGFPTDHDPDTLQMLGAIEARLEELINGLDEAFQQDGELVMELERKKEKDRRERVRVERTKEQLEKQEERLRNSLQRSQAPVFKKDGKQVMYRSPPLRQERRVVKDTSEDEANARDHKVFGMFIEKKSQMPQTEPPELEADRRQLALKAAAAKNKAAALAEAAAQAEEAAREAEAARGR